MNQDLLDRQETDPVLIFVANILEQDSSLDRMTVTRICNNYHAGNGYFSYDGILDSLTSIIGYDRAREIVGNC